MNNKETNPAYVIKNGDVLTHKITRKELPVYKGALQKVYEDDEIVVVNKPPSIPVHSCGGYFYNTVISIAQFEMGYSNIHGLVNSSA